MISKQARTRRYVLVALTHAEMIQGWSAFRFVRRACLREGVVSLDRVTWLRSAATPVGVTALFEVV